MNVLLTKMSSSDAYTDVVELCALLQCLGFSVKSLKSNDGNMSQEGGPRTVVINCQASGLYVMLESASLSCSCPPPDENSGVWQMSGVAGGKHLDKEFGCTLLGSLPKVHRERLTRELHEMIRCIKDHNESDVDKPVKEDKSASLTDLKTPEKLLFSLQAETPTRYRSLDTLTTSKDAAHQLPALRPLQRNRLVSDCDDGNEKNKFERQSTYTLSSTPGSTRHRNKTSSPIHGPQTSLLSSLIAAEKAAEDLRTKLAIVIREFQESSRNKSRIESKDDTEELFLQPGKNDSFISSLAFDVSKISMAKAAETSKAQFASSPNLSGISTQSDIPKSLKRFESVSTSNLVPKSGCKERKESRLRRMAPNMFKKKENSTSKVEKPSLDTNTKLNNLFKSKVPPKIAVPAPESSPNLSSSSRKKFSHIKSTIPRLAKKE